MKAAMVETVQPHHPCYFWTRVHMQSYDRPTLFSSKQFEAELGNHMQPLTYEDPCILRVTCHILLSQHLYLRGRLVGDIDMALENENTRLQRPEPKTKELCFLLRHLFFLLSFLLGNFVSSS
jgi:hypothetical protein